MKDEIKTLKNRGVWRVVPMSQGVRLIKSKYVYDPNNTQPESNKESNLVFNKTSKFNGSQISKAVVNTIMGHSMSDMKVKKISENLD